MPIEKLVSQGETERKHKVKWRMAPLLSGQQLLQTDPAEAKYDPFVRVHTDDMIDLIGKGLTGIKFGNSKHGKKTTLIRDTGTALLKYLGGESSFAWQQHVQKHVSYELYFIAAIEEEIECVNKHTKDATTLRGHYRFKSAEVKTMMRLARFFEDIAGTDFKWEHHFVLCIGQAAHHT